MKFDNALIKQLIEEFKKHSKDDINTQEFIESLHQGNNIISQKLLSQTRYFHQNWVEELEEYKQYLDNIIRNPRSFLRTEELIVPIERAKKTSPESVRHLAANSQYIKDVDEDGFVMPSKILTIFKEEELATYENRFIRSLIDKLVIFIERRYQMMVKLASTKYINRFTLQSNFKLADAEVDYLLSMSYKKNSLQTKTEVDNFLLIDKVDQLRKEIMGLRNTEFMQILYKARPVYPPIQKTNIITKDPNYKKCYELWLFLDSYETLDVEFELYEKEYEFNNEELTNLYYLVLFGFNSIIQNINLDNDLFTEENKVDSKIIDALRTNDNLNVNEDIDYFDEPVINERVLDNLISNLDNLSPKEQEKQLIILEGILNELNNKITVTKTQLKSQEILQNKIFHAATILKNKNNN